MSLLCIGGSLRPGSLSTAVLERAADLARADGTDATVFTVRDLSAPLEPGRTSRDEPAVARLEDLVREATALLIVTPVYGGTPSGAVKNLLDVLHLFKDGTVGALAGRRVVVGAVGGGAIAGSYEYQPGSTITLEIACQHLGAWVSPRHLEFSELAFSPEGELVDPLAVDALRTAVRGLLSSRVVTS